MFILKLRGNSAFGLVENDLCRIFVTRERALDTKLIFDVRENPR